MAKNLWQPGQSGNPAGRKPGSGHVGQLRDMIKPYLPELLQRMVLQALAGDVTVQRLLLEKVFPSLKAQAAEIQVELAEGSSLVDHGETIIHAIADGSISPDVGAQIVAALGSLGALRKVDELEARIAAIEAKRKASAEADFDDIA